MTSATYPLVYTHPKNWCVYSANDIRSVEAHSCVAGPFGSKISSKYFVDDGVPVIRGGNLRDDLTRFVPNNFVFLSDSKAQEFRPQIVIGGDLVFTCWGTIGQVGIIPEDGPYPEYIISNKQLKLRVNLDIANPLFCFYYFASPRHVEHIRSRGIGGAVPGINLGILKSFRIALPSIKVQEEIVGILASYDNLIEYNLRRIALLEESARQVYQEWFVRLRFPGCEHTRIVEGVPEGWERMPVESALVLQRGFDLPSQAREEGAVPIYASTGVNGYHNVAKVQAPGIVTGRSGSLGMVHYVQEDFWPLNTSLWVKDFRKVTPLFAFFLLTGLRLDQYNGGVSVPTLDRKVVHKIEVVIPPSKTQNLFGEYVLPIFQQLRQLSIYNDKLRATRDLLLPKLMSGEISV
jgi:type I restriction enzyme, S subunit